MSESSEQQTLVNTGETDPAKALELKKLALEIADLQRPWWKRPSYILAALPTLLAVVALSVGLFNGFFSAQLTKLENQRHDLESQIKEFEGTRNSLVSQNQKLQQEILIKNETLNEIDETIYRLNMVLFQLAIADVPNADPETPEQKRKAEAKAREEAKSELSEVMTKLREILAKAGIDSSGKSPGTADIRLAPPPATTVPRQRQKKR